MKCVSSSLRSSQVNIPWWSEDKWCSVRLPDADTSSTCCLHCSETMWRPSTPVWFTMICLWLNFHTQCVGGLVFGAVQWIVVVVVNCDTRTGAEKKRDQIISSLSECGFRLWWDFLNIFYHQNDSCGGGCGLGMMNWTRRSLSGADISSKAQQSIQAAPHLTHISPLRENVQKGPMLKKEN